MKKIGMPEKQNFNFSSPTLITAYSQKASDFIYSIRTFSLFVTLNFNNIRHSSII